MFEIPTPTIKIKPRNANREAEALAAGIHPMIAGIAAARQLPEQCSISNFLSPKLRHLSQPFKMQDMNKAAIRLAQAIMRQEIIALETDHDCDGQTSHALLVHNLVSVFGYPATQLQSYIGHRLNEGYGLSAALAYRILEATPRPHLVITADNGSSDELRIAQLKKAGIDVIVTDHHAIPKEGIPKSAYACLNPTRTDCAYGDPYIAGCMVAWLLMAATRKILIQEKHLSEKAPTLMDSLDFVAVGTVADCVSMARSLNNRIVVHHGLTLINEGHRACWRALKYQNSTPLNTEDLAFKVAPLLNSDGRLSNALGAVAFLLTETNEEAMSALFVLQDQNQERKKIQETLLVQGLAEAKHQIALQKKGLCIYLPNGHMGIHGVAASRLKDWFGRPTVFLAPKLHEPEVLSASLRGIEGFHVRQALQYIDDHYPDLLKTFGGHQAAGGLSIALEKLPLFREAFEAAVLAQEAHFEIGPVLWTDGLVSGKTINLAFVDLLQSLQPFGREFDAPLFELKADLQEIQPIGDGTHARLLLLADNISFKGIWFKCKASKEAPLPVQKGHCYRVLCFIQSNTYQAKRRIQLQVIRMEKL